MNHKMNTYRKVIAVLVAVTVATQAVFAGAWFAGCTERNWTQWLAGTGWSDKDPTVMCVVPNDYYQPGNLWTPSCNGIRFSAGFCDPSKWGWYCSSSELKGWGWKRPVAGVCIQQYNADGTPQKFNIPCKNIEWDGSRTEIRTQCNVK